MNPSVTRLRVAILTHWNGRLYELGIRCGIDRSELCRYQCGVLPIPTTHRAILASVLGVEPHEIDGWWDGAELWEKVAG